VRYIRSLVGTRPNGRMLLVLTVNGSVVWTRFVTLYTFALPPGPSIPSKLYTSGLAGTSTTWVRIIVPLLFRTRSYGVPSTAAGSPRGTTKSILWRLTRTRPHEKPLIVIV